MNLSDLQKEISSLEREELLLKTKKLSLNVESFNFNKIIFEMIYQVNTHFGKGDENIAKRYLKHTFSVTEEPSFYDENDRKKAINLCLTKIDNFLKNKTLSDDYFYKIFSKNTIKEKDRVRAIVNGEKGVIVSKESERKVINAYKRVFRLSLLLFFDLIKEKEFYKETFPYFLLIFSEKGTILNKSFNINYVENLLYYAEDKEKIKEELFVFYQENNFFNPYHYYLIDFSLFSEYAFLLTKGQQKECFISFKKILKGDILSFNENNSKKDKYSEKRLKEILSLKEQVEMLSLFERTYLKD